jgi:uncharacterized damage-inducible protein DinB
MAERTPKSILRDYLQHGRGAIVWKLDKLSDYDIRRPLTPTGTNLLGIVKHLASIEFGYFGDTFDRPSGEPIPWFAPDAEPNADMWATADESREQIVDMYRRSWAHAEKTFDALELDDRGSVPWWTPGNSVTLQHILVHMIAETHRHAGHADIVRELIDGEAGIFEDDSNMPPAPTEWWADYRAKVQSAAETFRD